LSGSGLIGKYDIKEDHKNNTLEITSSKEMEGVYDLSIEFIYNHTTVYSNQTKEEKVGKGIIASKSKNFNVTLVYAYPDYEVLYLVNVDLDYKEHTLEEADERISFLLNRLLTDTNFEDISNKVSDIIRDSLDKWGIQKENEKLFELTRRIPKKSYNVSYRESLAFDFNSTGVISLMEGDIEGEQLIYDEDSEISAFRNFDPSLSSEQVFIHKKILINLFKLGNEKKLSFVTQEVIDTLKPRGLKKLDIETLSKFYPSVLNYKPLDGEFYIEYYVNSVIFKNHDALVDYTFFFVSYDEEVLIKLNVTYNIIFEVIEDNESSAGKKRINFILRDKHSFKQRNVKVISPVGTRTNKSGLAEFLDDLLVLSYQNNHYVLLDDYASFDKLIENFDTVKPTDDGFILYHTNKRNNSNLNLKFLN